MKARLEEEGAIIRSAHFSGAGGSEVVRLRTELIDRTLSEAYVRLADGRSHARAPCNRGLWQG